MEFLEVLLGLGYIGLIIAAIYLYQKRQKQEPAPFGWKHLGIAFCVLFVIGMATGGTQSDNSSSTQTSQQADSATESSASEESLDESTETEEPTSSESESDDPDEDPYAALSAKERDEFNQSLDDELIQDQKEAENGENAYAWSLFVGGIVYDKQRGFIVKVNDNFQQLSNANKTIIGHSVQSFIQSQLLMIGKDVQPDDPYPYINFHYGYDRVGHSRMWDPAKFKFSES